MTHPSRHSVSVAAVVVNNDGHVLVTQRRDNGEWQLPGGILELGETIDEGVRREVLEETGIECRPTRLTGVYKNMKIGVVALVFHAEHVAGQPQPTNETQAVTWWTPDQVSAAMSEAFAVRILDALGSQLDVAIRHHDGVNLL